MFFYFGVIRGETLNKDEVSHYKTSFYMQLPFYFYLSLCFHVRGMNQLHKAFPITNTHPISSVVQWSWAWAVRYGGDNDE